MPLILQPIQEIKQASEPAITKIENSSIDLAGSIWIVLLFLILCIFRKPIFEICLVLFKMALLISFAYITYTFV